MKFFSACVDHLDTSLMFKQGKLLFLPPNPSAPIRRSHQLPHNAHRKSCLGRVSKFLTSACLEILPALVFLSEKEAESVLWLQLCRCPRLVLQCSCARIDFTPVPCMFSRLCVSVAPITLTRCAVLLCICWFLCQPLRFTLCDLVLFVSEKILIYVWVLAPQTPENATFSALFCGCLFVCLFISAAKICPLVLSEKEFSDFVKFSVSSDYLGKYCRFAFDSHNFRWPNYKIKNSLAILTLNKTKTKTLVLWVRPCRCHHPWTISLPWHNLSTFWAWGHVARVSEIHTEDASSDGWFMWSRRCLTCHQFVKLWQRGMA